MFIISCSAGKSSEHEKEEKWVNVIRHEEYSKFQEFAALREQIMNFYSAIDSAIVAKDTYRGFRYQNPSRWKRAWKANKELYSSGISRAIYRYTGKLYSQLDPKVRKYLATDTLNQVLIISALHGPTIPSDYLPFYDLTMRDLWKDKVRLKNKWPQWIKDYSGDEMKAFLSKFEDIYIMVGNDYKPVARAIKEMLPNLRKCQEAPSFKRQSNTMWGQKLNKYLSSLIKAKTNHK